MSSQQKNINNLQTKVQSLEEEFLYTDDCPYSEKIETLQDRCDALVQIIEIQAQRVCLSHSMLLILSDSINISYFIFIGNI